MTIGSATVKQTQRTHSTVGPIESSERRCQTHDEVMAIGEKTQDARVLSWHPVPKGVP